MLRQLFNVRVFASLAIVTLSVAAYAKAPDAKSNASPANAVLCVTNIEAQAPALNTGSTAKFTVINEVAYAPDAKSNASPANAVLCVTNIEAQAPALNTQNLPVTPATILNANADTNGGHSGFSADTPHYITA